MWSTRRIHFSVNGQIHEVSLWLGEPTPRPGGTFQCLARAALDVETHDLKAVGIDELQALMLGVGMLTVGANFLLRRAGLGDRYCVGPDLDIRDGEGSVVGDILLLRLGQQTPPGRRDPSERKSPAAGRRTSRTRPATPGRAGCAFPLGAACQWRGRGHPPVWRHGSARRDPTRARASTAADGTATT